MTDTVEIFEEIEQGTPDWFAIRRGLPTASKFATIMANGKGGKESVTRRKLLYQLAGERLTGEPMETFTSGPMERGKLMEAEAREFYARRHFADLKQVGFIRRTIGDLVVGCSPDALIGDDGALEIKTMRPDLIIDLVMTGGFPTEHKAQIQGTLWVSGRDWEDLQIFYRDMPVAPKFRVEREPSYIAQIAEEVERFEWELRRVVSKIQEMAR